MISKNKAIIFASIAALLITVMIAALMWLSGVYRSEPAWLVVVQTLAILSVFAITFWGIFLVLRREKVNQEEKQLDNWRVEEIKRLFSLVWRKHGKLFNNLMPFRGMYI
ncbi:hypothetical protein JCM19238_5708 [Vibrio ponticus]|nr:hypothetical protein JCM19238_5708 [Vibrio ponticus]